MGTLRPHVRILLQAVLLYVAVVAPTCCAWRTVPLPLGGSNLDLRQLGGIPVGLGPDGRQVNGTGGLVFPLKRRDGHVRGHTRHAARGMLANGTLPLHGAVKDLGYFYAELKLGTPAKRFAVIVDTGSTMTYVPCIYCTRSDCGQNKMNPAFDPAASSTFEQIACRGADARCQCGSPACGCEHNKCSYTRYYAESSTSEGHMVSDMMHLSDTQAVRVAFGCETRETGEIFHQAADGLMGLGGSDVSIPHQLAKSGAIEPVFSLCFGDTQGSGALMIGNVPLPSELRLHYVPLVHNPRHPHYYNINLHGISIASDRLAVPQGEWKKGYETVLDSGTTFSYIPRDAFRALKAAISQHASLKGLRKVPGPDPKYVDECWGGAPENPNELPRVFPAMSLHLDEGFDLELLPINYLFIHTSRPGAYCLGIFDNGDSGTLLGGITFRNILVQYDKRDGKDRVGLAHAPCKLLGCAGDPDPECCASSPSYSPDGIDAATEEQQPQGDTPPPPPAPPAGFSVFSWVVGAMLVVAAIFAVGAGVYVLRLRRRQAYIAFETDNETGSDGALPMEEVRGRPSGEYLASLQDVPLRTPTSPGPSGFDSEIGNPTFTMVGANSRSEAGVFSAAVRRMNSADSGGEPASSARGVTTAGSGLNPATRAGSDQASD